MIRELCERERQPLFPDDFNSIEAYNKEILKELKMMIDNKFANKPFLEIIHEAEEF